jgi:hypothetical protein
MANRSRTLHLLVPGLLGPMPYLQEVQGWPGLRLLERILARSDQEPVPGTDPVSTLFSLFGIQPAPGEDPPAAAYRRMGDGHEADDRFWLELNPIHLLPDQDRLLLFPLEEGDLTEAEAEQCLDYLRRHFRDEQWHFQRGSNNRWYLALKSEPRINTFQLAQSTGRNMDLFLPRGGDAVRWHGVLNEIQMLFHSADFNLQREVEGRSPVSGVWLSGGGRTAWPRAEGIGAVYDQSALARGLAKAVSVPARALPESAVDMLLAREAGGIVASYDLLYAAVLNPNPHEWVEGLAGFQRWLHPLVGRVQNKALDELRIYPCNGRVYRVTRAGLRRFWRPGKPFAQSLDSDSG